MTIGGALEVGALVTYRGWQTACHGLLFRITAVQLGRYDIALEGGSRNLVLVNVQPAALTPVPAAGPMTPTPTP